MKTMLVSLPWSTARRPSAALGALAAYVRSARPTISVDTAHTFLDVAFAMGPARYAAIAERSAYQVGEALYGSILYPETTPQVERYFVKEFQERAASWHESSMGYERQLMQAPFGQTSEQLEESFARLRRLLMDHLDGAVSGIDWKTYDVVGLTTSFAQLFANLCLAKALKEAFPRLIVVLGGSTVSGGVGPSLLGEYGFLDFVVQGEGELPFTALLSELGESSQLRASIPNVLSRGMASSSDLSHSFSEVRSMDELPPPDYDEFYSRIRSAGIQHWYLPMEGSRGCWWDRSRKTGDASQACYFCNLNVQWNGYREKSPQKTVSEMVGLAKKYRNNRVFFLDNIMRAHGVQEFAELIRTQGMRFSLFYEMRAHIRPYELLVLWEAGLEEVQFGIEALSNGVLKKIGKGTTVIQNLRAMKLCAELGIRSMSNVLVDFPGTTAAEVEETVHNINTCASAFEPLIVSSFYVNMGNTVERDPNRFGVTCIRNADYYRVFLPPDVYERLDLFDKSFESEAMADWSAVRGAVKRWSEQYASLRGKGFNQMLSYKDSGEFLTIEDLRGSSPKSHFFDGVSRDLYMQCHEITSVSELQEMFPQIGGEEIVRFLDKLESSGLVYREKDRVLSLACAERPSYAAERIRRAFEQAGREKRAAQQGQEIETPSGEEGTLGRELLAG